MLRRGYIVLIAGAALLSGGIVISIVISVLWAESFARQLRENTIINETILGPHSFAHATLEVKDIERIISVVINSSSPVTVSVTDPNNTTVKLSKNPNDLVTFKPETAGKYTLHIMNKSSNPVNLKGIFGYVPMTIENNQTDVNQLNGIFLGSFVVVSGIITFIIGIIFVILDRSTQRLLMRG